MKTWNLRGYILCQVGLTGPIRNLRCLGKDRKYNALKYRAEYFLIRA